MQNYMEILVDEVFDEIKDKYVICKKEEHERDIKTIALNNLPPVYFLSSISPGEKQSFLVNRQQRITVLSKITEAIDLICLENENSNQD